MRDYYLFLDESKPNDKIEHFCMGGCIIEKEHYINDVIPYVRKIKSEIFGSTSIILHEVELRDARTPYTNMRIKEKRELFWDMMKHLFDTFEITVISSVITPNKCKSIYQSQFLNDEYFISLQILLENYVYFLEKNDGKGAIFLESRNHFEDNKLQNHYFNLLSNGTLFLNKNALQTHLTTISFPIKQDDNIGLQIADFIPNVLKKSAYSLKQRTPSLLNNIQKCIYDGGCYKKDRFGMKIIP